MNPRIRPATLADIDVLTDFNARMARETEHRELDLAVLRGGVSAALKDPHKGKYYVAESEGKIVGQLLLTNEWSDWRNGMFWWIQSVYVPEAWRGKGVFSALFAHVRTLAGSEQNVAGLRLYVEKDNAGARRTYEKLGMTKTEYDMYEIDLTGTGSEERKR